MDTEDGFRQVIQVRAMHYGMIVWKELDCDLFHNSPQGNQSHWSLSNRNNVE